MNEHQERRIWRDLQEVAQDAACSVPEALPYVDAAFERGRATKELRDRYCYRCPIWDNCLMAGMTGEPGPWGGMNKNQRSRARNTEKPRHGDKTGPLDGPEDEAGNAEPSRQAG